MKPGGAGTMTHDYKRNGTTTLFAALDVASGQVIGQCRRATAPWSSDVPRTIDSAVPAHLDVHLVLDNSSTHKTPRSSAGSLRHPRFTCTSRPPPAPG